MHAISVGETPLIGGFELAYGTRGRGGGIYPLAALTVRRGETVRMALTIENNTGAAVTLDLGAFYGRLVAPGDFRYSFRCIRRGVSIGVGTTSHHVDCVAGVGGTGFAAAGVIGKLEPPPYRFEHLIIKENQLTVTGVIVMDFALARV